MSQSNTVFLPFYDRSRRGDELGYPVKIAVSLGAGFAYLLLQYLSADNKNIVLDQYCWVLATIISVALLALYIATDLFRRNLGLVEKLQGQNPVSQEIIGNWLTDRGYLISGLAFATVITFVGYLFGVPLEFESNTFSLGIIYLGFFLSGFTCGLGLYSIVGVIVLYLKLSPCLYYTLDPMNVDGAGGIKRLGDALWFFALLTAAVGMLVSIYLFGVSWTNAYKPWVQVLLTIWLAMPYVVAISIVLIPGLAIRRNVQYFKQHRVNELRQQRAEVYSSMKNLAVADDREDREIVAMNRDLKERLNHIQQQLANLKSMRDSHIDREEN